MMSLIAHHSSQWLRPISISDRIPRIEPDRRPLRSPTDNEVVGGVPVLQQQVHAHHLAAFNVEALRVDQKWRPAKTTDDFGRMKEGEFLNRLVVLSIIAKNVKAELVDCLDRHNGCGHPNSMKLGPNTVAHHLGILLLNVPKVF